MSRVVLKVGGRVAAAAAADATALAAAGHDVVVVHGAGPQISGELERRGLPVEFVGGRRVTTPAVLAVVRASLLQVNAEVCAAIGGSAVGLLGDEVGLLADELPELGRVGAPLPTAPTAVLRLLGSGRIPVVAPLAVGRNGSGSLNVNADEAAAALAIGLGAERILFVTDVPGVLVDGGLVEALPADEADRMLVIGAFDGGIVPKLMAAVSAVRQGVRATIGATEVLA